jgi:hypothetical protein
LAAVIATEIQDRNAHGDYSNYFDFWGSLFGDASVGLAQIKPSTARSILHYGHLRTAIALWNKENNIHVAAQYIKALREAAEEKDQADPTFHFYFVGGTTHMTLAQYKSPMKGWDQAHKELLAQQYTQRPWQFDPNSKFGYTAHISGNAQDYFLGVWENYTSPTFTATFQ